MCLKGHNPYFSRWFSAIHQYIATAIFMPGHNPYFSRWFSAIDLSEDEENSLRKSQSLF